MVWLSQDDEELRFLYPRMATRDVALKIRCTISAVNKRAQKLGLKKSPAYLRQLNKDLGRSLQKHGKRYQFKRGIVAWNKGKRLVCAPNAGNFRKGQMLVNHKTVGTISIRHNYQRDTNEMWIKIAEPNKWRPYRHYIFKKHFGRIPADMCVAVIDGDPLNIVPENLKLISRAENARRNRSAEKAARTIGSRDLTDKYVAIILSRGLNVRWQDIVHNKELIQAKRQILLTQRMIRNEKQAANT